MSLIDDYQNMDKTSDDGSSAVDPNAARRKRADLERQIVILDSDLKKTLREIEAMEQQKRRFKKEEERLRIDEDSLDKNIDKMYNNRKLLEEEIRGLKKKLKTL